MQNLSWYFTMAWRDSRRSRSRLFLFTTSIILGIAALVAINSFDQNLKRDVNGQAKTLLTADLSLSSNQAFSDSMQQVMDTLGEAHAFQWRLLSMVSFPKTDDTRLAQVRSLKGNFPIYGTMLTNPPEAAQSFQAGGKKALVGKPLAVQFDVQVGDSIKIGEEMFQVEGILESLPGESGFAAAIAPSVCIPHQYLPATELVQVGSRVFYRHYFQIEEVEKVEALVDAYAEDWEKQSIRYQTVEGQKEQIGDAFTQMTRFLNLVGFVALLLGCIGVASAVHVYIREKIKTVAVLRCLGAKGWQAFLIYLIQVAFMGFLGSVIGAALGSGIQFALPAILQEFIVIDVSVELSFSAIFEGLLLGVGISILFALLPLISILNVSPLQTLRASYEPPSNTQAPLRWLVYLLIAAFIAGFSFLQIDGIFQAIGFSISLGISFLLLTLLARLLMWAVRKYFPVNWSYVWRQGLANLYRPNNQTLTLMVSIGLGTALITTLYLVQGLLLQQVSLSGSADRPNMVLFNIQPEERDSLLSYTKSEGLPIMEDVPVVTMRLVEVNGKAKNQLLDDTTSTIRRGALRREYRATYRDSLTDAETLVEGEWQAETPAGEIPKISMEKEFAMRSGFKLGDKLVFNVQGAKIETEVGNLRDIQFGEIKPNFFVVFPKGVLEKAPQFYALITRTDSVMQSAIFQQEVVQRFPSVSVIDLSLILKTVDDVITKVSFVIRFMALFSILTGLIVLMSSVINSRYQRVRESVLLRTLGANRRQILLITALEYGALGFLAAFSGGILAIAGTWALAYFSFQFPFVPNLLPLIIITILISLLTASIGLLNSRSIVSKPPLEVLRG